jgi:hypothetical protein
MARCLPMIFVRAFDVPRGLQKGGYERQTKSINELPGSVSDLSPVRVPPSGSTIRFYTIAPAIDHGR